MNHCKEKNNSKEQVTSPFMYEVSCSIKGIRAKQYCTEQTEGKNKTRENKLSKTKLLQVI